VLHIHLVMSASLIPLLRRPPSAGNKPESCCNKLRNASLICQPLSLILLLAFCIFALLYPWWQSADVITHTTSSHPYIENNAKNLIAINDAVADVSSDAVGVLPGLSETISAQFTQYSGYVDALDGRQLHYWYFEAQEDATDKPLFVWTNGGPGCSGLLGLLSEQGPLWATDDGDLMVNEYAWTQEVNMVFFEQPYGVGFSVVTEGHTAVSGDAEAVADFDAAIRSLLTKFSLEEYDVYLSAESYGGHYMPLTALQIMEQNDAGATPEVQLKGFMVGNPYTNSVENNIGSMEAWYGHGLVREDVYEAWRANCLSSDDDAASVVSAMSSDECRYLYVMAYYEASADGTVDNYALDFTACADGSGLQGGSGGRGGKHLVLQRQLLRRVADRLLANVASTQWDAFIERKMRPMFTRNRKQKKFVSRAQIEDMRAFDAAADEGEDEAKKVRRLNVEWSYNGVYYPCAGDLITAYLNEQTVQESLNVESTVWDMCNEDVFENWPDADWDTDMAPKYAELARKYPELKIMIYSGDDDSVCGLQGTQYWLSQMGEQHGWSVDEENDWVPWQFAEQLAGFQTNFLTADGEVALYLHTVRTAGHMVPQTQPERALGLLRKYLYELD